MGWFRRRRWAWMLSLALVAINLIGDFGQLLLGETLKGVVGVVIAGLVVGVIWRPAMREYFAESKS